MDILHNLAFVTRHFVDFLVPTAEKSLDAKKFGFLKKMKLFFEF